MQISLALSALLQSHSQPAKKQWWEHYVKHDTVFYGVSMAEVRQVVSEVVAQERLDEASTAEVLTQARDWLTLPVSEEKIAGILLLEQVVLGRSDALLMLPMLEEVFANGAIFDWNVCDWLCVKVLHPLVGVDQEAANQVLSWVHAENVWQARASVVAFVNSASATAGEDRLLDPATIEAVHRNCKILILRPERFAKTAVGWWLREYSKVDERFVEKFLTEHAEWITAEVRRNARKHL